MRDFNLSLKTEIMVGTNFIAKLGKSVKKYSKKVLLVYGGGSIKKNGIYDEVINSLKKSKIEFFELSGIVSNPVLSKVNEGIKICEENNIDFVIPVGGGSVWDTSKAIAAGVNYDGDVWDFFSGKHNIPSALPLGGIFTIAATSTESNPIAVITNEETKEKTAIYSEWVLPKFSISDPKVISTLPKNILKFGAFDIISHLLEGYFDRANTELLDQYSIVSIKRVMQLIPLILKNQNDLELCRELLFVGSFGHSGLLYSGRAGGDWASHKLEHVISGNYPEIIHGEGLAIVFPAWMKVVNQYLPEKFEKLFLVLFEFKDGENIIDLGIEKFINYLHDIDVKTSLKDSKIKKEDLKLLFQKEIEKYKAVGQVKILVSDDTDKIIENMYL